MNGMREPHVRAIVLESELQGVSIGKNSMVNCKHHLEEKSMKPVTQTYEFDLIWPLTEGRNWWLQDPVGGPINLQDVVETQSPPSSSPPPNLYNCKHPMPTKENYATLAGQVVASGSLR
jgi:hypothetical protein